MRSLLNSRLFAIVALAISLLIGVTQGLGAGVGAFALLSVSAYGSSLGYGLGIAGDITMLDIAKLNGTDPVVDLIEENLKYAPEVSLFPFRPIKGTSYKTGIRTGLPTTGFRGVNEGQTPGKSTFKQLLIECFPFGGQIEMDKLAADADERGAAHIQSIEASGVTKSAFRNLGSQIWYGVTQDTKGFPGVKAATLFGTLTSEGDALTVNAGGTTAATASSVYAVKFGEQDSTLIGGMNKTFSLDEFRVQQIVAANNGKLTAYVSSLDAWIGLQIGHENCVRRIANLTADAGKGLTDLLLASLLATYPVGFVPDAIFMSRRSRTQLQSSRTVVLQGQGRNRPDQPVVAPIPSEYDGVPIYATDSILNTDIIES